MALTPPVKLGLRTIHNGSHDVAKASIVVPAGGELTVPEGVADQLQRDGAFKAGPAPEALLEALYGGDEPEPETPVVGDVAPVKKAQAAKKAATKKV